MSVVKVEIDREKLLHLKDALDHIANQFWLEIDSNADASALTETINLMNEWLKKEEE